MRLNRHRSGLVAAALLACGALASLPASVAAATANVTMSSSYDYDPSSIKIARGDTVKWKNTSSFQKHDVTAGKPAGLFKSSGGQGGLGRNATYSYTFNSAGTFLYVCLEHQSEGMQGTVVVPIAVTRVANSSPVKFKVKLGLGTISSTQPWERYAQVDPPGGGTNWQTIKHTKSASFKYTPTVHGTYRFQAWLQNTSSGAVSNPSPAKSISY